MEDSGCLRGRGEKHNKEFSFYVFSCMQQNSGAEKSRVGSYLSISILFLKELRWIFTFYN